MISGRGIFAHVSAGVLALAGAAGPTIAQLTPERERPPLRPPSEIARDVRDAGFEAWNRARTAPPAVPPVVLTGGRYVFVVHSARSRERESVTVGLRRALEACANRFELSEETQVRLVEARAFQSFDAVAKGIPLLAVTIVPSASRPVRCSRSAADELVLLQHGLRVAADTIPHSANDVATVEVLIGEHRITPTLVGSAYVTRIAPGGHVAFDGTGSVRVYLDIGALAPQGNAAPLLRFRIGNEQGTAEDFEVPSDVLEAIWREILPWRAARLASASASEPLSFPTPKDPVLRAALDPPAARSIVSSAERVLGRLDATRRSRSDRVTALMHLGFSFDHLGDQASARVLLRRALQAEPCLQLPATARPEDVQLLDELRPATRCEPVPALQVVRWGIVPGGAHRRIQPDRLGAGLVPLALTGSAAVASIVMHLRADALYAEYRRETLDPDRAFIAARDAHVVANQIGVATYALWGASIAHALYGEWRLKRRTAAVSNYGADDDRPSSVRPAAQGLGLSLSVF